MRVGSNRWLRGLFLSSVYLFGALGIIATGGGSGGSGVRVDSIDLDQPASRTYEPSILVTGNLVMIKPSLNDPGDKYSDSVKVKWRNHRTGKSGSENHKFSGSCVFLLVTVSCANHDESSLSIQIKLAIGSNKITVEADGKEASINVTRLDDRVPPGAPTNVSVATAVAGATVTWDTVPRGDSYNIYYASNPGLTKSNYTTLPDGTKIASATSPQDITGLANGTVYYFVVTAINVYGDESAESMESTRTGLEEPTGVSVLSTNNGANVTWKPVSGAISYNIYYASSSGVTRSNYFALQDGTKLTDVVLPHSVTGLTNEVDYYFVVTSENAFGESLESSEVSANIGPTLSFDIKTFRFTWTDVTSATHYKLLENPDGISGFSQVGGDIPQGTVTFDHIVPLYKRMNASYYLQSCDGGGCTDIGFFDINQRLDEAIGYFKASNTGSNDGFGTSVSLSGDGNTLAVGASQEGSGTSGINTTSDDSASGAGAVYVFSFSGSSWSQQAYIKASNTGPDDQFGRSVSLSDNGNTLAVGAMLEDSSTSGINTTPDDLAGNAGAVYLFSRSGSNWSQEAYIKASNSGSNDLFGRSVSLSGGGDTLAVGAGYESSSTSGINTAPDDLASRAGAVYVFSLSGSNWSQQAYVKASNTDGGDHFGNSVSLSGDGNILAVGAGGEASISTGIGGDQASNAEVGAGAVYVFNRSGTDWSQQAYVKASNNGRLFHFGTSVSLSGNGNTLAVGSIYESSSTSGINTIPDDLARSAGAAYVFSFSGSSWSQHAYVKASNAGAYDNFGSAVNLDENGDTLAISAPHEGSIATGIGGDQVYNSENSAGAVYIFSRSSSNWSQQAYVKASNTERYDQFGNWVSLSGDGNTLAVGASEEDSIATGIDGDQADNSVGKAGALYLY